MDATCGGRDDLLIASRRLTGAVVWTRRTLRRPDLRGIYIRSQGATRVRGPGSAELRRGWIVDAAIEAHFKALLATGEALPQRDIEDIYAAARQRRIDDAAVEIDWGDDTPEHVKETG